MQFLQAVANVRAIFSSFDFFEMSVSSGTKKVGIPPSFAKELVFESPAWAEYEDVDLFFFNNRSDNVQFIHCHGRDVTKHLDEKKYVGNLIAVWDSPCLGLYFETLERLGFICGEPVAVGAFLRLSDESNQLMSERFHAEMRTLLALGRSATTYVKKMAVLLDRTF